MQIRPGIIRSRLKRACKSRKNLKDRSEASRAIPGSSFRGSTMDDAIEQALEYRVDEMTIRCSTTDKPTQGPERLKVLGNSQRRYEIHPRKGCHRACQAN